MFHMASTFHMHFTHLSHTFHTFASGSETCNLIGRSEQVQCNCDLNDGPRTQQTGKVGQLEW